MYNKKEMGGYVRMEKHIIVTGSSSVSWEDAVEQTISEASKTIDYLTGIKMLSQTAKINGKKIIEYFVTLDLAFTIDRDRN